MRSAKGSVWNDAYSAGLFLGAAAATRTEERMDNALARTENLFVACVSEIKEELWTLTRT